MRERYHHHGWNLSDDDVPRPPECSPIDSAQRKRWIKSLERDCRHQGVNGFHIDVNPSSSV